MLEFLRYYAPCDCCCGHNHDHHHDHDHDHDHCCHDDMELEEDPIIEIVDPDTGEKFEFYYTDEFEHEDKNYAVLVTMDEENPSYVIGRIVEGEDGESYIETLDDEEGEAVYEAYEKLLAEYFEDLEEEDEE